jgi:hypothetical protein
VWCRFLTYGAMGMIIEVVTTGSTAAVIQRDRAATGKTYLWMLPIYGLGGLLLERISDLVHARRWSRTARALAYLPAIYGLEAASGAALRCLIRRCPWDYTGKRLALRGLVRLDYAPLWLGVAYLFEPVRLLATAFDRSMKLEPRKTAPAVDIRPSTRGDDSNTMVGETATP